MSYLDLTRLNFMGYFQADVSSINNVTSNYDIATFDPATSPMLWNPVGTGSFRLLDCRITGGSIDGVPVAASDPCMGVSLENSAMRVAGKLVDLDPQQQAVSEIWGMKVRLAKGENLSVFNGDYLPAPFINLWTRQQKAQPGDQKAAAVYQSILQNINWSDAANSPLLQALQAASPHGCLSINMNVYGYSYSSTNNNPRYTMGQVVGSIGPYDPAEPKHFVVGRQMVPTGAQVRFNDFTCLVHARQTKVSADLGNALMLIDATSGLAPGGDLILALYKQDSAPGSLNDVPPGQVEVIGTLTQAEYTEAGWYGRTAGIVDFDYGSNAWLRDNIATHSLLLLGAQVEKDGNPVYPVHVQESLGGLYVRSDNFVFRLNPGEQAEVELIASQYGQPLAQAAINLSPTYGTIDNGADSEPPVCTPADAIGFPPQITSNQDGKAHFSITASSSGPGNPRGYIDGQVYGIGYQLATLPPAYVSNNWNFISLLAFDATPMPEAPTWYQDIQPVLKQYANLYPIMSKYLVDLANYGSVVDNLSILQLAFSLPRENPNHMPVTRDLSRDKRDIILRWLTSPGPDGLPLLGTAPVQQPAPAATAAATAVAPAGPANAAIPAEQEEDIGKTGLMRKIIARQNAERSPA